MKKMLALMAVLGVVAIVGSATLATADCSYHKAQMAMDKADTAKPVATAPADTTGTGQVQTAQAPAQPAQPAAEIKK
jgi:hypothetical protein